MAEIVAKNADELSSGTGTATLTFVTKHILPTDHRMNPQLAGSSGNYTEGTGAIGGWDKSEMKDYITNVIKPLFPAEIRNAVKTVKKYTKIWGANGSAENDVVTDETFFIPSRREIAGASPYTESQGVVYSGILPIKRKATSSGAVWWWLRSANTDADTKDKFIIIGGDGNVYDNASYSSGGVVIGFCT